jgi:hypothetical protein
MWARKKQSKGWGIKRTSGPGGKRSKRRKRILRSRRGGVVVEACHSWLNCFRKLLVRYEKKAWNYMALVEFAYAIIIWRNLIPIHPGLIPG